MCFKIGQRTEAPPRERFASFFQFPEQVKKKKNINKQKNKNNNKKNINKQKNKNNNKKNI